MVVDFNSFMPLISGIIGGSVTAGVFKGPVKTLEELWYISFGYSISEHAEKLREKQKINIEKYKNDIATEVSKISPDNVRDPQLNILGPSLEVSKYYINDEEIRHMFAKLVASSMDISKDKIVHNSYVEIIKQLSPVDARIISFIHENPDKNFIANLIQKSPTTEGFIVLNENLFLVDDEITDQELIAASLSNLSRLGLINIDYSSWNVNEEGYNKLKNTKEYKTEENQMIILKNQLLKNKQKANELKFVYPDKQNELNNDISEIDNQLKFASKIKTDIQKGLVKITPFGSNFCNVCL